MTRSHNLKAQEAERTEQGCWRETRSTRVGFTPSGPPRGPQASALTSIVTVLVKADEHVVDLQLFLRKLQQKSKTEERSIRGGLAHERRLRALARPTPPPPDAPVFAALGKTPRRNFHVQVPSSERHPPGAVFALGAPGLHVQEAHPGVGGGRLLQHQQLGILERVGERQKSYAAAAGARWRRAPGDAGLLTE